MKNPEKFKKLQKKIKKKRNNINMLKKLLNTLEDDIKLDKNSLYSNCNHDYERICTVMCCYPEYEYICKHCKKSKY